MICICACSVTQSYPTLFDPIDCSPPSFSVHGIFQGRILEWVAISFSKDSSKPRDRTWISWVTASAGRFFSTAPCGKPYITLVHMSSPSVKIKLSVYFKELLWQKAAKNIYPSESLECYLMLMNMVTKLLLACFPGPHNSDICILTFTTFWAAIVIL